MSNVLQQIEDKIKEWTINIKFVVGLPGLLHSVVLCLTCIMYPVIYLYSSILLQSNYTCNTYANEGNDHDTYIILMWGIVCFLVLLTQLQNVRLSLYIQRQSNPNI